MVAGNTALLMSYRLVSCAGAMRICHEICPASHFALLGFHQVRSYLNLIPLSLGTLTIVLELSALL